MSNPLCQYKNIFGKPGEGLHQYRIPLLDIAIVDVVATIIVAYLLSYLCKYMKYKCTFLHALVFLILLGIVMHRLFCVETKVDQVIFG